MDGDVSHVDVTDLRMSREYSIYYVHWARCGDITVCLFSRQENIYSKWRNLDSDYNQSSKTNDSFKSKGDSKRMLNNLICQRYILNVVLCKSAKAILSKASRYFLLKAYTI